MFTKKPMSAKAAAIANDANGIRYGSGSFTDIVDWKKLNIERWKPSEGMNEIDIVPYNAGPNNPYVLTGKIDEGETTYVLDVWVHSSIGASRSNYVCLKQFGKECPICKEASRLWEIGTTDSKEKAKKLFGKRRMIFHVHDLVTGKYGYWNTGAGGKGFYDDISKLQQVKKDGEGNPINPFDWKDGRTITFLGSKDSFEGHEFISTSTYDFKERGCLSDEVLDHAIDFADGLIIRTPEELEQIIAGNELSSSSTKSENVRTEETNSAPKTETPSFDTMPEMPAQSKAETPSEPAKAAPVESGDKVCPYGHKWGDAENHPECTTCKKWEDCFGVNG